MSKPENEKLKSEFSQWILGESKGGEIWLLPTIEKITDWWLKKIAEREAESREKMIKKTTGILRQIGTVENDEDMEKVINIIKNLDD